jgi:predicted Fe-S protein YdhL (DUF1289 family)
MRAAACAGYPSEMFFSDDRAPDAFWMTRVRIVCATCPVRRECLDHGTRLDYAHPRDEHGVYAGMTDAQRRSLRRTVCVGCRRGEDPVELWSRAGNWRATHVCDACDAIRARHRAAKAERERERRRAVAVVLDVTVLAAEDEWWERQRAALGR